MAVDGAVLSVTLLAAAEARNFVTSSVGTCKGVHDAIDATDATSAVVRRGEYQGAGLGLAFGAACSLLVRSWWPFGAAVLVTAATVAQHEAELRRALPAAAMDGPVADVIPLPSGGGTAQYDPRTLATMVDT